MFKNYIKIAFRILTRSKVFSFINIFGLAVGLTSCLIVYTYVSNELSYDKFHHNYENIYRVATKEQNPEGISKSTAIAYPFSQTVRDNLSGYEQVCFVFANANDQVDVDQKIYKEDGVLFVGKEFPKIFKTEVVSGDIELLKEPYKAMLTENTAKRYFGDKNPIGEIIRLNNLQDYEVVGIVKDTPSNTHLPYHILISEASLKDETVGFDYNRWNISIGGFYSYIKLKPETNLVNFEEQLPAHR